MAEGKDPVQNKLFSFCVDLTCFCCLALTLPVHSRYTSNFELLIIG